MLSMQCRIRQLGRLGRELFALILIACVGCTSSRPGLTNLNSAAWMQTSEEHRAVTLGAYNTARQKLDEALTDMGWTAVLQQQPMSREEARALGSLPPAIIIDIDETVLDTLPYQTWLVKNNERYSPLSWNAWVSEAKAEAVPGALPFVRYAMEKGVKVFYLSNRDYQGGLDTDGNGIIEGDEEKTVLEPYTIANLERLGFLPQSAVSNEDSVLLKGELTANGEVRKGWQTSDKTARRLYLASRYRILLLIGDSLVDFVGYRAADSDSYENIYRVFSSDRNALRAELDRHQARWGESWILLPNPMYGAWAASLYGFMDDISVEKRIGMKLKKLDAWQ